MSHPLTPTYTFEEFNKLTDFEERLKLIIKSSRNVIQYFEDTILKLKSVVVPMSKKTIHSELIDVMQEYKDLEQQKLDFTIGKEYEKAESMLLLIDLHKQKMDTFSKNFLLSEA